MNLSAFSARSFRVLMGTCVLAAFSAAATSCADSPEKLLSRALALEQEGKQEEALKTYQQAVEKFPDSSEGHLHLAKLLSAREKYGEAVKSYQKAIEIDPDNLEARLNFSGYYFKRKNYLASLQQLEEVVRRKPESEEAGMARKLYPRVETAFVRKELRNRITYELRQPGLKPEAAAPYKAEMAKSFAAEGRELLAEKDPDAVGIYEEAVKWAPDVASYRAGLAQAYDLKGEVARAADQIQKASELEPSEPSHLLALAGFHIRLEKKDEAAAVLKRLIEMAPISLEAELARRRLEELERVRTEAKPTGGSSGAHSR